MTDPIADFLARIRNAGKALLSSVEMPHSRIKEDIARILVREGYLAACDVSTDAVKTLRLKLKYDNKCNVIRGMRRVSRPGLRHYVGVAGLPRVLGGLGTAVVSTPGGVMTASDASRRHLGGEVLCYVW